MQRKDLDVDVSRNWLGFSGQFRVIAFCQYLSIFIMAYIPQECWIQRKLFFKFYRTLLRSNYNLFVSPLQAIRITKIKKIPIIIGNLCKQKIKKCKVVGGVPLCDVAINCKQENSVLEYSWKFLDPWKWGKMGLVSYQLTRTEHPTPSITVTAELCNKLSKFIGNCRGVLAKKSLSTWKDTNLDRMMIWTE